MSLMKNLDPRLKILAGIIALGFFVTLAYFAYQYRASSVALQYGDPENWPRYESGINNLAFRVPEGFEVIPPADFENVPFSIVKAGERGESVLLQVGTNRLDTGVEYANTEDAIADYEQRFVGQRETIKHVEQDINGRKVITLVQEEANGRIIGETLAYDTAVMVAPDTLEATEAEVREISLQIPASASTKERNLYLGVYLQMIQSLEFLYEPATDAPAGVPSGWTLFKDAEGGLSFWLPPDWELIEEGEELGMRVLTLGTLDAQENGNAAEQIIRVLPGNQSMLLAGFMTEAFVQPFRDAAVEGTLLEETVGIPGVGEARSLEARHVRENVPDATDSKTLLVIVGGPDTPQAGRGYVLETSLSDGKANELRLTQLRSMTQSLRLIGQAE
jgi:hypothetical protein